MRAAHVVLLALLTNAAFGVATAKAQENRLYGFTGARTGTSVATTVHCSNVGTATMGFDVQLHQWNGSVVYSATLVLPPNNTATLTFDVNGQGTELYLEDAIVATPSPIGQGMVVVASSFPHLICGAQVLDRTSALPAFVVPLPLFQFYLFRDDFESGGTALWSSQVP